MSYKTDDIKRRTMNTEDSGKKQHKMKMLREIVNYPDKGYDPLKLFRQRLADNNDKNAPRHLQREDDVAKQEYNYLGDKEDKYSHIKEYLRTMNMK